MINFDASNWAGKVFKCGITGHKIRIPDDVKPKQFFQFGESFIDVGDGIYSRAGGQPLEVTDDDDAPICPNCGQELRDSAVALCLCPNCGVRCCEGSV